MKRVEATLRAAAQAVVDAAETDDDFDGQYVDWMVPDEKIGALRAALAAPSTPEPSGLALTRREEAEVRRNHTGSEHQCQTCMHPRPCLYERLLATIDALRAAPSTPEPSADDECSWCGEPRSDPGHVDPMGHAFRMVRAAPSPEPAPVEGDADFDATATDYRRGSPQYDPSTPDPKPETIDQRAARMQRERQARVLAGQPANVVAARRAGAIPDAKTDYDPASGTEWPATKQAPGCR